MPSIPPVDPGLCGSCTHARQIVSSRGSRFTLCEAHKINPSLEKYPALPVLACPEYKPGGAQPSEDKNT